MKGSTRDSRVPGALLWLPVVLSVLASPIVRAASAGTVLRRGPLVSSPTAPFTDGAPYPGPLPVRIPAGGGTIQAANFNRGPAEQAFHACTPGDQGNASSYRADPHDIDIFSAPSIGRYIQSSSSFTSSDPAHNCPSPGPPDEDYVKYSFTVAQAGWYKLVGRAQNGQFLTRIDDVQLNLSGVGPSWSNVALTAPVHLKAGFTHVLAIDFYAFATDFASVKVLPTKPIAFPAPRVVSAPLTKDEVVVADAVATDKQFGAVPNKPTIDNAPAIQRALNLVGSKGGGTVYLPPGVYTVKHSISIPANVTLRGDWSANTAAPHQTILRADVPSGTTGHPLITMNFTDAQMSHLSVWYPHQNFTHPLRYPPTIYDAASWDSFLDVTLFDSDQGIALHGTAGAFDIRGLRATCFTSCVVNDRNGDFAFLTDVKISDQIWASGPPEVTGKPTSAASQAALRNYTTSHLTGIHLYQNDNITAYGVTVTDALQGIATTALGCPTVSCGTYGSFSKISASFDRTGDNPAARGTPGVSSIMDTDLVSQANGISYRFAPPRLPARKTSTDFYNVRAAPYSAHADAVTDDTAPIQAALNAAAQHGGGTVYLPAGTYLVKTHLTVPTGVELRGAYDAHHSADLVDATMLVAVEGQGTTTPNTATAFISMKPHAGVRGISVRYPNQGFGSPAYPVTSFPYTFRSLGAGTWLLNTEVINGYEIADFATHRSDGFVIKNIWATAFSVGVNIGGKSNTGWVEQVIIHIGQLYFSHIRNAPHSYGFAQLRTYLQSHTIAYELGDSNGLESLGADSFVPYETLVTYRTSSGSTGPTNATFFASSSDSPGSAGFTLDAGNNLNFLGLLSGTNTPNPSVVTTPNFTGVANIYDSLSFNSGMINAQGGTLNSYPEAPAGPPNVTVTKLGFGAGTVTSTPAGINCGTTCSASFPRNATLVANADPGNTFLGWGGACHGTGSCVVYDAPVTATFSGPLTGATSVAAGDLHSCALLQDSSVACWGYPASVLGRTQVPNGQSSYALPIPGLTGVTAIAAGGEETCALMSNASIKCWGSNTHGQIGDGTTTDRSAPTTVTGITTATAIGVGPDFACAVLANTTVDCWGANDHGQLGDGTTTDRATPAAVSGLTGASAVTLRGPFETEVGGGGRADHACALLTNTTVKCWGSNQNAELGDGTTTDRHTPVSVSGLTNVTQLAAGPNHVCARLSDGTVECWGNSGNGALGDGTTTFSTTPVVASITNVSSVTAILEATCALLSDTTVHCVGRNAQGELGDGTTTSNTSWVTVSGLNATSIRAGWQHSCAIASNNQVECWGWNQQGQIGNGTQTDALTPQTVIG
jgi:alpha-tubulin suppressor-like RCC1 family protein